MSGAARRLLDSFVANVSSSSKLSPDERQKVLTEVKKAKEREAPPTLVIIGEAGVGKTTTINSLFNAGQPVSARKATTLTPVGLNVKATAKDLLVDGDNGLLRVFDMPGLGDRMSTYQAYKSLYLKVLPMADVVLWVHPAEDRMVQFLQSAIQDLFGRELPHLIPRLIFGLNKADRIAPDDWNKAANVPSQGQLDNLDAREEDFSSAIREALPRWRGSSVVYSAWTRYQLTTLFKSMIYAVPENRRWVLEERMSLADFFELVDRGILHAAMSQAQMAPSDAGPVESKSASSSISASTVINQAQLEGLRRLQSLSPEQYNALVSDAEALVRFLIDTSKP